MKALAAMVLGCALAPAAREVEVEVQRVEGELVASVHAQQADAQALLAELARQGGRRLSGASELALEPLSVALEQRPYELVVRRLAQALGCVARLGVDTLELAPEPEADAPRAELDAQAEVAWLEALRLFPTHALGAQAELELAALQERRGNLAAARTHLASLVDEHPDSERVPEALWRAARLLQRLGRWDEAWSELSTLASFGRPHPYHVRARLELARTSLALGDPRQAQYVLDALEQDWPVGDSADLAERLRIRAQVELARNAPLDALRTVDQAERLAGGPEPATLALRARALEASGRYDEASRAWLRVVESGDDASRAAALADAARLALVAGDELAVLFVHRLAQERGLGDAVAPFVGTARERLGLVDAPADARSAFEAIARAEELLAAGRAAQAFDATRDAWLVREGLDEPARVRLASVRARAQDAAGRVEDALASLRSALGGIDSAAARRALYLLAGELLEARGRFDQAAEAYRGRL